AVSARVMTAPRSKLPFFFRFGSAGTSAAADRIDRARCGAGVSAGVGFAAGRFTTAFGGVAIFGGVAVLGTVAVLGSSAALGGAAGLRIQSVRPKNFAIW